MKRLTTMLLALSLTLACCLGVAAAADDGIAPLASVTITKTSAVSYTGDNTGEIDIEYNIMATGLADKLGVSTIVIHKPDGSTDTVTGTTKNGLVGSGVSHLGTYTYTGIAGKSYYAEVTLFSTIGSNSDSRTITTRTVTAKM